MMSRFNSETFGNDNQLDRGAACFAKVPGLFIDLCLEDKTKHTLVDD